MTVTNLSEASVGVQIVPIIHAPAITSGTVVIGRFKLPYKHRLLAVSAVAEAIDYTTEDETYAVEVKEAGTTVLSSAIAITAAQTVVEGAIADEALADEAVITVEVTVGGTTPSITGTMVLLTLQRTT